jgi:oligopeptide/dipeptide ABC transporter ATP-binding protein
LILEIDGLQKYYPVRSGVLDWLLSKEKLWVRAVDGVSLAIGENETLGLVGESGSGKTTLGRTVVMLERPTGGRVVFQGKDLAKLSEEELRKTRRQMQIVFQNPTSSLDPRQRVKDILAEPLKAFAREEGSDREGFRDKLSESLRAVGLSESALSRFPHEFSGGQRQRISIARALILGPAFLVLDEPTSALDSSIQVQVLNLLRQVQEERKLSYLFITHNVSVVRYMADRVAVMYAGKIAEVGRTREVLTNPMHPYTMALISSVPEPDPTKKRVGGALKGEVPSSISPPMGCRFSPRCPYAKDVCFRDEPQLRSVEPGRWVSCHFAPGISAPTSKN